MSSVDIHSWNIVLFSWKQDKNEASSLDRINMTKNWLEFDRKILTTTNFFDFRLYSHVKVRRCGNIYYNFGQIHHINVRRCQFFGHVHHFCLFGHNHLVNLIQVKWITLQKTSSFWMVWKIIMLFKKMSFVLYHSWAAISSNSELLQIHNFLFQMFR